jgi:UDP-2,3-diacylglucosamine pyrophosphatase LpxH
MAWWSRLKRRNELRQHDDDNVLVISDVHLGEDILVEGPEVLHSYIRALNGALMGFLQAHAEAPEDGRAWHLVINGDMFDFVKMPLDARTGGQALPRAGSEAEAQRKLERILRVHRPLFVGLAQFVLAGHRITIVEGNHDAEFYFDSVRGLLRQHIVRLAEAQLRRAGQPASGAHAVGERLAFSSWFVAAMGRYHIEHGHQYDPFSSFEHKLAPLEAAVQAQEHSALIQPMSHRLLPQIAELMGDFSTHGITSLTARRAFALVRGLGLRGLGQLLRAYATMGLMLLRRAGGRRRRAMQQMAASQARRLRVLGAEGCYSAGTLRALDKLRAPPAEYSLWRMVHLFWFDRVALMLLATLTACGWMALGASPVQGAAVLGFAALGALALCHLERPHTAEALRHAAAHIAQVTGARHVIFGHSHVPEHAPIAGVAGAAYINCGSWVTREILRGDAGVGMTFVKITAQGAQLLRWRDARRSPVVQTMHDADGEGEGEGDGAGSPRARAAGA